MFNSEKEAIDHYKEIWKDAPYPPTFVTADVLLTAITDDEKYDWCILLIKRKDYPGKGLWALPGGFVNQHETIREAAFRELEEECGIPSNKIEDSDWIGINNPYISDGPYRDPRGRFITHIYALDYCGDMNAVKAGDDAAETVWVKLDDVEEMSNEHFFADHLKIIRGILLTEKE